MTTPPRKYPRQEMPFSAGVFLTELKRNLTAPYLCQKYLVLNKFLYHIRSLRTESDLKDFPALNRHIRQKGIPYDRNEHLFTAFKTILKFQALKSLAKKEDRRLIDSDLLEAELDEKTYLRAMREVARYLAWKEDLIVPDEILEATKDCEDDDIDLDEIASVSLSDMADNHSQRSPIVFIVDTSMAMRQYLDTVSDGFNELFELINKTRTAPRRRGVRHHYRRWGKGAGRLRRRRVGPPQDFRPETRALRPLAHGRCPDPGNGLPRQVSRQTPRGAPGLHGALAYRIYRYRWLRNDKVNTHLDEQLDTLARKCDPDVHDFEVHTIIPSPEIAKDEALMENINRIPGWKYKPDDLNRIFSDIFRSIRISRSEAPANDVPLKISGTL